jgi:flagellar hook-associated protein 1 FlgK
MSNLFTSLSASSTTLAALQSALTVTQNNVDNASTPGYARQSVSLESMPFLPGQGLSGGVTAGELQSARDRYADAEVRRRQESSSYYDQKTSSLSAIETSFDITDQSGITGAFSALFQSFSAWSASPNSGAARQTVLDGASRVAQAFHDASAGLEQQSADATQQIRQTTQQINDLTSQLRADNAERIRSGTSDPALDAKTQDTLEQLSQLADITALQQSDGSVTVLLGGQTPLVVGDRQFDVKAEVDNPVRVLSADGSDITAQISQGKLAALLDVRNRLLPTFLGDGTQAGDLNRLASAFADRVNQLLSAGQVSDGPPAQAGVPLFTYDTTSPNAAARTLAVNPAITGAKLAAIDPGPPYSVNGTAIALAGLATPTAVADKLDGFSYTEFYGSLAARAGSELSTATDAGNAQKQLLAQAKSLRDQASGVSLDEEAVHLIEFQRAYQAAAKMTTALGDMTQTVIDMLR